MVRTAGRRTALYASVGRQLIQYDADLEGAALIKRGAVTLPANVQYVWPHASGNYLYIASSDGGPEAKGASHWASALRIDAASGALQPHGEPVPLRSRPIHVTTDIPAAHALISYNDPSGVTVHRINRGGTLGDEVPQAVLDCGIYAHQARVAPSNGTVILVTRGNDAADGKPEDPGALKLFDYADGRLQNKATIAPEGGHAYGPRHLDFHPAQPWIFVSLERQNRLQVHRFENDALEPEPLFTTGTLADARNDCSEQKAGTVHVHPNGGFVYVANRARATRDFEGRRVFAGGENNIAVYALDPRTGEPALIQHADTLGIAPRTFALDPGGRMLVAANHIPLAVKDGTTVSTVPASLAVFRIGSDGRLAYARKYDVDVGRETMFWMGMMQLQGA
jgi:6-phosphogluconolactonase (cycloisomerase 2 family)